MAKVLGLFKYDKHSAKNVVNLNMDELFPPETINKESWLGTCASVFPGSDFNTNKYSEWQENRRLECENGHKGPLSALDSCVSNGEISVLYRCRHCSGCVTQRLDGTVLAKADVPPLNTVSSLIERLSSLTKLLPLGYKTPIKTFDSEEGATPITGVVYEDGSLVLNILDL